MYCIFCGAENPHFASFCEKCGRSVKWETSAEADASGSSREANKQIPAANEQQSATNDATCDNHVSKFQKTYSEMTDETLLRLVGDVASLTEPAKLALEGELLKRGLQNVSVSQDEAVEESKDHPIRDGNEEQTYFKYLWVSAWFIALLLYNVWSHWSQNADKDGLLVFADAAGRLTTPAELLLSAVVVGAILSRGRSKSRDGTHRSLMSRVLSHPATQTIFVIAGMFASLVVVIWVIAQVQKSRAKYAENQTAQATQQNDKAVVNPNALDDYEIMSKANTVLGNSVDGLTPQAKKRMREMLALEFAGAMQKQNNPLKVDVIGDNHDELVLQLPTMNEEMSTELINGFSDSDANFWNGLRLMDYSQVLFSGDNYHRIVTREEIVGHSKDYDKYKAAFLKAMKGMQAGAQREATSP